MKFRKLNEDAILPRRGTRDSAGYDMRAIEGGCILPGCRLLVKTGIGLDPEEKCRFEYLQLFGRSGLAYKKGIMILAGVIDSDYEGEIGCILYNSGNEEFIFNTGDAIAQGVIIDTCHAEDEEVPKSLRGDGGYGSTGK